MEAERANLEFATVGMNEPRAKVLVIDDEHGVRESLSFLMIDNGYMVLTADTIEKGISLFADSRPDLVIMDIKLPDQSGIVGLQEIRKVDQNVPIIMLTGYGSIETAQQAIHYGANEYLNKPFYPHEILDIVDQYVRRKREPGDRIAAAALSELNSKLNAEISQPPPVSNFEQLSAEYAHDLSNPLTSALGGIEFLKKIIADSEFRLGCNYSKTQEYLEIVSRNIKRCYDLSKRLQNITKNTRYEFSSVDVKEILDDVVNEIKVNKIIELPQDDNIEIVTSNDPLVVFGDKIQLFRVVFNLVINAIHALPEEDGSIVIESCCKDGAIEIRVVDNGNGMPQDQLKKIFDPFYTSKNSIKNRGTGLGLSITKKIIEEHNGSIQVKSELNEGTEFIVRLPRCRQLS